MTDPKRPRRRDAARRWVRGFVSSSPLLLVSLSALTGCTPPGKPAPPGPSRPADVTDFRALYATNCAGCHGADGTLGPGPPLNDPLFLRIVPDAALLEVITNGRPGTPMPAFDHTKGGPLTTRQVKIIADGLKPAWGKPATSGDPPVYAASFGGDKSRGKELFARACAGCHGDRGQGGGSVDGRPVGAVNDPAFLALCSDQVLRRYIITGRPDLGMPDYAGKTGRPADFKPPDARDVADLTALLASWRTPAKK